MVSNLYRHVDFLTRTPEPRNFYHLKALNLAADYIASVFKEYSDRIESQPFRIEGQEYKNIICSFGPEKAERIIVGAHYDVCGNQAGADDNASAVAGLLEIGRLLSQNRSSLNSRIDLVSYTLEEPPFFGTEMMGSSVHAQFLKSNHIHVKVMLCLEMIGYFSDETNSQKFPLGLLGWFYPSTANFISIVSNLKSHSMAKKIKSLMQANSKIKIFQLTSPALLPGVDFSDHRNYWKQGYKAVMITDTAFYRNPHYHQETDLIETLDFRRMAEVVRGVEAAIVHLAR